MQTDSNLLRNQSSTLPASEFQRAVRFMIVGISSTVLDFLLLALFKHAGATTLLANSSAFALATLYNFTASRSWTYASEEHKPLSLQFGQYVLASLLGLVVNDVVVLGLEAPLRGLFGDGMWSYLPAKVVATGAVAILSFVTNRMWVFNSGERCGVRQDG